MNPSRYLIFFFRSLPALSAIRTLACFSLVLFMLVFAPGSTRLFHYPKIPGINSRFSLRLLGIVEDNHVDPKDTKKLIYGAIKGMVGSLDAHSSFMAPEEFKELQIETKGSFSGIGIEITLKGQSVDRGLAHRRDPGLPRRTSGRRPDHQNRRPEHQEYESVSTRSARFAGLKVPASL